MKKVVYGYNDYGYIEINLKEILEEKQVTRNALARAADTRFEVINKWCNGQIEKIDADILARICHVLECTPDRIIRYVPND